MKVRACVILFALLAVIVIISFSISVFAHNNSQVGVFDTSIDNLGRTIVGNELNGWRINESKHLGGNTITFSFDEDVSFSDEEIEYFYEAVAIWHEAYPNITITEAQNSLVTITKDVFFDDTIVGIAGEVDANGHFVSVDLIINAYNYYYGDGPDQYDFAHEIGHIIGLYDLENPINQHMIMYGYNNGDASAPGAQEIWSVRILQNQHYTHEWIYSNTKKRCYYCGGIKTEQHHYVWSQYDAIYHRGVCSDCGAVVYERHYHYHNNILGCMRCGYNGPIAQNTPDPVVSE